MESDCRHVALNDNPFTARMRFHQSWYLRHVLGLKPGRNPHAKDAIYGSQLTEKDGGDGLNVLTAGIWDLVQSRIAENHGIVTSSDIDRLKRNLLSSQPMCFNLFAPLADDLDLATRLVRTLPGLPSGIDVVRVEFEYRPGKKGLFLGDGTLFDAFLEYERPGGVRGFVGIETKLTEPFSRKAYEFADGYSRWMEEPDWWWRKGAEEHFPDVIFNQLWRNSLLVFAVLYHKNSVYDEDLFSRALSRTRCLLRYGHRSLPPASAAGGEPYFDRVAPEQGCRTMGRPA